MNETAGGLIPLQGAAPSSARMIRGLVGVAALSGLVIAMVFQMTLPTIKAKKAKRLQEAVFEVVPDAKRVMTFKLGEDGTFSPLVGEDEKSVMIYAGYGEEDTLLGVAIEARGQGYQDVIKVLYGYSPEKASIVGMKVLESKETPGLGDKIAKDSDFQANFRDLDVQLAEDGTRLKHPIETVKKGSALENWQIDAITGATISSNAIGKLLNESAQERIPQIVRNLTRLEGRK
jgi:electron transport complex protein RnfG